MTHGRRLVRGVLPTGLVLLALAPVAVGRALAQEPTHVAGQVQDSITQKPIAGVRVGVKGTTAGTLTDATGHFAFDVPAGRDSLTFKRIGYRSVVRKVAPVIDVVMSCQAMQLEGSENRITGARNRYIKAVQEYNVTVRSFPTNLTAMIFKMDVKPNFTVENEKTISVPPTVDFGKSPTPPATSPAPAPKN